MLPSQQASCDESYCRKQTGPESRTAQPADAAMSDAFPVRVIDNLKVELKWNFREHRRTRKTHVLAELQ